MTIAETSIQIKAVYECRKILRDGWQLIHAPNEEVRSGRALAKQMALGMCPGVPDLIVFSPQGKPHFMEFKAETGALNESQQDFQLWSIRANIRHSVVRSVDQALQVFRFWGAIPELVADTPQPQCDRQSPVF